MKKPFIALIVICFSHSAYSQVVGKASGSSSILLQNTNLGFDFGETQLSFNTNSKIRIHNSDYGINLGGSASTKNKEGIGELFSSGNLNPSSQISGIIGIYRSNSPKTTNEISADIVRQKRAEVIEQITDDSIKMSYKNEFIFFNKNLTNEEKNSLRSIFDKADADNTQLNKFDKLVKNLNAFAQDPMVSSAAQKAADTVSKRITILREKLNADAIQNSIVAEAQRREDLLSNKAYYKIDLFLHGGVTSESFKLFKGWDTTDLSKSFTKENFQGGSFGVGLNYRYGAFWLAGIKYSYVESNNSELLTSTDYNISDTKKLGTVSYSSSDKISAYSGTYDHVFLNKVDVDLLRFFPLNDSSHAFMIIDAYFRNINSNNESLYPSRTDLGVSSLYFKQDGRFMGGIYLELPDITENAAKQDNEFSSKIWYKRLTFGVYAKFSFNALLGMQ